jgi:hypothetical protein
MILGVRACIPLFAATPRTRQTHRTPGPCPGPRCGCASPAGNGRRPRGPGRPRRPGGTTLEGRPAGERSPRPAGGPSSTLGSRRTPVTRSARASAAVSSSPAGGSCRSGSRPTARICGSSRSGWTPTVGRQRPRHTEHVEDFPGHLVRHDLGAHLDTGDEVLMDKGVEDKPRLHAVGREEEVLAVGEAAAVVVLVMSPPPPRCGSPASLVERPIGRCRPCGWRSAGRTSGATRASRIGEPSARVEPGRAHDARQVGDVDVVDAVLGQEQVAPRRRSLGATWDSGLGVVVGVGAA